MSKKKMVCGVVIGNFLGITNTLLLFVRTGILIKRFGVETNSISQAANQIFAYFILMESGMGAAYLYKMYAPMLEKNFRRLSSYYRALCISMKHIAVKMCVLLIPVVMIYPFFMRRKETAYMYAVMILLLLGIRFAVPYYVSVAAKNLLVVYGYKWLVDIISSSIDLIGTLFEIIMFYYTNFSIINILFFSILLIAGGNLLFRAAVRYLCPELSGFQEEPDYTPETMTRDIIFHQIGGLFNNNVDTLILSFINLSRVTVYQAYYSIANYPINFMHRFSEIFRARIGLDIARKDGSVYSTFQQLLTVHLCMGIPIVAIFYSCIADIITLWIGKQYVLTGNCVLLLSVWIFDRIIMNVIYIVRDGKGLYKESKWYSLIQGILNLFLSLLLVGRLEIEGLLAGSILANLIWNEPRNFSLVYKRVFRKRVDIYKDFLVAGIAVVISVLLYRNIWLTTSCNGWIEILRSMLYQGMTALIVGMIILIPVKAKYIRLFIREKIKKE